MRKCRVCGLDKTDDKFYKNWQNRCKQCVLAYNRERYHGNIEQSREWIKQYTRKWREENPERYKKIQDRATQKRKQNAPPRTCPDCGAEIKRPRRHYCAACLKVRRKARQGRAKQYHCSRALTPEQKERQARRKHE